MKLRRLVVVLTALVLIAGACSSRGEDTSASGGGETTTSAADAGEATETFGTIDSPCGDAGGTATTDTTTGAPDETQGITAEAISVGTVADPGFSARPGLNQEIFDAGEAFVKWCNDQGGINGRELDLTQYDAAFTEYQTQMQEACGQEFAIVGDGAVQDNQWADTGAACGLIDVAAFSVTPERAGRAGDDPVEGQVFIWHSAYSG